MDNKYIILCSNYSDSESDNILDCVKEIAPKWFNVYNNSSVIIINTLDKYYEATEIRDKINHRVNCSVLVFQIRTTKNAAACRNFASDKLWNWIKDFDSNDDIKSEPELIPDVGLNNLNRDMTRPGL